MALASHPDPGTRVDVITSCLRSKIETSSVPTVSFAMGNADTDVQLCPLSCAHAQRPSAILMLRDVDFKLSGHVPLLLMALARPCVIITREDGCQLLP